MLILIPEEGKDSEIEPRAYRVVRKVECRALQVFQGTRVKQTLLLSETQNCSPHQPKKTTK